MKIHFHLPLLASLAFAHTASAQEIIKAPNEHALNLTTSWSGGTVPVAANTVVWNASSSGTFVDTAALGANLSWQGIRIDDAYNTYGKYTITGTHTLTLGSSGIGITGLNLWFENPLLFAADAELRLNANSKGITFNGPNNFGGHTLTVVSTSHTRFLGGSGGLSNGTLRHTTGQSQFNAASTGAFNLLGTGNAQIMVNHAAASNSQLNVDLTDTCKLSLGLPFDNLTFQIGNLSGTPGTWITTDYLQATGSPAVVRTLAVNQTIDNTFTGLLSGSNNNRALGLIKNGSATLTLTNPNNEYSGPTTINAGTLHITGAGRLNHRPVPTQPIIQGIYPAAITNNATLHIDSTATQTLSGTMTGSGTLLKSNTGFLTLTGNGSGFTGGTLVNGGRLTLSGSLGGNVSLAANTSLGGTGTSTGSLTTAAGASMILSGGATTSALSFHSATINGPTFVEFASPQSNAVVYEVLSYGAGGLAGYENIVPLARGTLGHDVANKKVVFTAVAPGTRTWNIGDGVWNSLGVLTNWAGGDQVFIQGDQAIFDAMDADTTITLEGLLAPSTVNVANPTHTYTFTGNGGLVGNGTLTKSGTGILQIGNSSPNFAGPTFINAGIFRLIDGGSWGTSPITNIATLEVNISSNFTLINGIGGTGTLVKRGSGTLTLAGATESNFTGNVTIESGRILLGKETALGYGNSGTKSVIINPGGQADLNGYADTQHKEVKKPWLTYTFKIAGDGDGTGAITNTRGGLSISIKDLDFAGIINLVLNDDASIGGTGDYDVGFTHNVTGVITGNGHTLTKRGSNTINLRAAASNITLVVQEGILGIENNNSAFGGASGSVTVNATGSVGVSGPVVVPTPVTLHPGATLRTIHNWYSPYTEGLGTWSGPVTLLGIATVLTDPVAEDFIISGTISGSGGIVKTGPKILTLNAANTYTGPTTVSQGTVIIQQPYLSDGSAVTVAAGATLQLGFPGTDIVGSLTLGGVVIAPGQTCDATTHPGLLAGTGKIQVANTTSDYINWSGSSGYHLSGGPDDDDDFDAFTNFEEYAFGLDPTSGASASPVTAPDRTAGTFTYTRRKLSLTQLAYRYESSTTLTGWETFTPLAPDVSNSGDPVESITVTVPAALLAEPEVFLRVKATEN